MSNIFSKLYNNKKRELYYERDMSPDKSRKLKTDIKENLRIVHEYLFDCDDVITRTFYMGQGNKHQMSLMFIDGMVQMQTVQDDILKPLMLFTRQFPLEYNVGEKFFNMVKEGLLTAGDVKEIDNFGEVILGILSGDTILFIDKMEKALIISTRGWEKRGVQEPSTEAVIRGPRDGFTETYRTNVALVRRRLKDPNLKVKTNKKAIKGKEA